MSPRMPNPSLVVPDVLPPMRALVKAVNSVGVPLATLVLVHLRVSQINGRTVHLPTKPKEFEDAGEEDRRLPVVESWREQSCFTDAERSLLALAEAATRIDGVKDPVSDEVWEEAARHWSQVQLAAVVLHIGLVNLWNRVNVVTKQEAVDWRINPKTWKPMTSRLTPAP
ncbi:carboxymuconolactone decarboxylase family protein [Streptomyces gilvifuscus]|uniref:Carboxymuconolactone decarboxylase family protein n=2 Tax=Streptomyces gilvifuscus TaxID=1550617 RepID=A0ABT5G3K1_9ACTN|nr:carboxymuconolactone decarboxylase family protein [Streptomyces gilvifuscus]MDC2959415.1 carboxymuconolactone decarboxylase family protein [Streptomyces gilvifuscus]